MAVLKKVIDDDDDDFQNSSRIRGSEYFTMRRGRRKWKRKERYPER